MVPYRTRVDWRSCSKNMLGNFRVSGVLSDFFFFASGGEDRVHQA